MCDVRSDGWAGEMGCARFVFCIRIIKIALAAHSHSSHYCRVESPRLVDGLSRSHCPHPSPTTPHTCTSSCPCSRLSTHYPCPHRSPSTHPFRTYHRGTPRPHGSTHRFTASHSHNTLLAKTHPPKTLSHKHIKTQQAHARTHGKGITTCRGVIAALIRHVLSSHHACNASAGAVAGLSATAGAAAAGAWAGAVAGAVAAGAVAGAVAAGAVAAGAVAGAVAGPSVFGGSAAGAFGAGRRRLWRLWRWRRSGGGVAAAICSNKLSGWAAVSAADHS